MREKLLLYFILNEQDRIFYLCLKWNRVVIIFPLLQALRVPCLSSRMGSALLSRFDLVFILLDTPNEDHDHLLSEHVMAMRAGRRAAASSALVTRASSQEHSVLQATPDRPLLERLKVRLVPGLLL